MANEYSKKTNADLVEILKSRSLPHTGKKADMVARLQEADKSDALKTKVAPAADAGDDVIDWDDDTTTLETPAIGNPDPTPATAAAGGVGAVSNPAAVPNQVIDVDPATTHDLNVVKPEDKKEQEANPAEASAAAPAPAQQPETDANGTEAAAETTEKPAVDYSIGLSTTDLDSELAKRKARAEKFGIVEEPATEESQKAIERAKRFGASEAKDASSSVVKGIDEPLSSERPRKRGRGDDGEGHGRGKRRNFQGRGRGRMGQGGGGPRRGRNDRSNGGGGGGKVQMSEQDRAALERRKERFNK